MTEARSTPDHDRTDHDRTDQHSTSQRSTAEQHGDPTPRPARSLRVAIVGSGPAGIYAGDILRREADAAGFEASVDLLESLPAPYGLIRYGVAPDHPRIKGIVTSLHDMLASDGIRLIANVTVGRDVTLPELRERYDAVILATGAARDADLTIPGIDRPGSHGAADFVSWYDGHPDVPRSWPLHAEKVAVIGNGNVALDVARVLAKHPIDMLSTEVPDNVHAGLTDSAVTDVHVFGRRGPGEVKFTPIELRELGDVPGVDVILDEDDFAVEDAIAASGEKPAGRTNQTRIILRTFNTWRSREVGQAARRLHLHFYHAPIEVLGTGDAAEGTDAVSGIRFERTRIDEQGAVRGTGELVDYDVQAVYRAVGYYGTGVDGAPFDERRGVIPNDAGRVRDADVHLPGLYATGWVKRGPVGLIGHTKGDALETVQNLIDDARTGRLPEPLTGQDVRELLDERDVEHTDWSGWEILDAHERALGEAEGRERIKVVPRDEQVSISREGALTLS